MEIPEKTWTHIVDLVKSLEEYSTYTHHANTSEAIIDLLRVVIADSERE